MRLSPAVHAALDYALALAFLALPAPMSFSPAATGISYASGGLYLAVSLVTRYPAGPLKLLSFPLHGVLEAIMAAAWVVMPWLAGFADDVAARNVFVLAGLGLLSAVSVTRYRETVADYSTHERRRLIADRRQQTIPVTRNRRLALDDRRALA